MGGAVGKLRNLLTLEPQKQRSAHIVRGAIYLNMANPIRTHATIPQVTSTFVNVGPLTAEVDGANRFMQTGHRYFEQINGLGCGLSNRRYRLIDDGFIHGVTRQSGN